MTITAFIFDFGNVICSFDPRYFLLRAQKYSTLPPEGLLLSLTQAHSIMRDYETGLLTSDEFYGRICSTCRLAVSRDDFIRAYTQIFAPIPSTYALIRELRPHYRLGLLSNTNEWHFEYGIKPTEVFPLFDTVTLSYEVKAMKPARRIYLDAINKLGVAPAACVYIDDSAVNVATADRLGFSTIHFESPRQLRAELDRLDLLRLNGHR